MSNNVQTAAQWAQVKDNAQKELDLIDTKKKEGEANIDSLFEKLGALNKQYNAITMSESNVSFRDPRFAEIDKQKEEINKQITTQTLFVRNTLPTEALRYRATIRNANEQIGIAESGPPNDNSTVQPAGSSPNANSDGNNTAVTTPQDTEFPVVNVVVDQSSTVISAKSDAAVEQRDFVFDPVTGEQVPSDSSSAAELRATDINPDDDPAVRALMESSRQESEDEFEFGAAPNTDDFINPADDPGIRRGPSRDDEGNLLPGFTEDETGDQFVGGDFISAATQASADASRAAIPKEIPKPPAAPDWRVRISLAPGAKYFYAGPNRGILAPLANTNGVIFPYLPAISVGYNAQYDSQTITHSNYKMHNYTGSSVDQVSITGDFTAQDITEANYMLAVIHFFRSATKMFYGQDQNPVRGTPPPLLYLSGHGNYQFDNHPMLLTNFAYALPVDVDYINAYPNGTAEAINSVPIAEFRAPAAQARSTPMQRLTGSGLPLGGKSRPAVFANPPLASYEITRVPTKITIQLTFLPVVTRNAVTNKFSLNDYASGQLLRGSKNSGTGGGFW